MQHIHRMPDNTRSLVVLAVFHSLEDAEETCIVWPNRAVTIVFIARLSGIQKSCETHREVKEGGEGKELHRDRVASVSVIRSDVKGYLAGSSRLDFIRRLRHHWGLARKG
jgi:hypothetical protein